jgi:hypothetical protein
MNCREECERVFQKILRQAYPPSHPFRLANEWGKGPAAECIGEYLGMKLALDALLPSNVIAIVSRNEKNEVIDRKFIINVGGSDANRS